MKAYKIQGTYSRIIYFVGNKKDVYQTLRDFFQTQAPKERQRINLLKIETQKQQYNYQDPTKQYKENKTSKSTNSIKDKSQQRSLASKQSHIQKRLALHVLLYDLPLYEFNTFQFETNQQFSSEMRFYPIPVSLHFAFVQSRQQSLRYIRKMQKYMQPEFQSNFFNLNKELQQSMEYDLVKGFLTEKFDFTREQVFDWMKMTGIKTIKELCVCQNVASYQKKELRNLLMNLSVLEELYQK